MKPPVGAQPDPQRFHSLSEAGARNAAIALSQIIGRPLNLEVPWAKAVPLEDVPEIAGGASRVVCALSLKAYGGLRGNLLLVFGAEQVPLLLRLIAGDAGAKHPGAGAVGTAKDWTLTDLDRSALQEVGNILAAAYLNALSDLLGASLLPSIPALAIDMLGAVTDFLQIEMAPLTDNPLVLASQVREPASGLKGEFFFLPDPSSYQALASCSEGRARADRGAR
jgi:chemotaxis protein CheC